MDQPYAFGVKGRASALPIALWCGDYAQGALATKQQPAQHPRIGFAPVSGAYVVCIEEQAVKSCEVDRLQALRFGRTNDFGWVLLREPGALGAPEDMPVSGWKKKELPPGGLKTPSSRATGDEPKEDEDVTDAMDAGVPLPRDLSMFGPDDAVLFDLDMHEANSELLYVLPNQHYYLFWSYDVLLFERFVADAERDLERAVTDYAVGLYVVQPFLPNAPVQRLGALSSQERGAVARLMSRPDGEGYHGGWLVFEGMSAAIFDATPAALRTLYLCEWLQWTCEHAVHDDPHWGYLLALQAAIRASQTGAPIADLAADLPQEGERAKRARQMRAYLHALAWAGMRDRTNAVALVDVWGESKLHGHWRDVAEAVETTYTTRHPAQDAPDLRPFAFSAKEREALVAYFEMYALGFRHAADEAPLQAHLKDVQGRVVWLEHQQRELMSTIGSVQLMRTVALHVRDGREKAALVDRYNYQCACHELEFWNPASMALPDQSAWDDYAPFVKWMAEDPGIVTAAFLGLLQRYVPVYRNLVRDSLERLLGHLFRYHLTLHGKAIEQTLPTKHAVIRVEPDPRSGRVLAKLFRGDSHTLLAELELLSQLTAAPTEEAHSPVGVTDKGARFSRYRRALARGQVRTFAARERTLRVLAPESPLLEGFPQRLTEAASLLSAGLAASALLTEMVQQRSWGVDANLYLDLAQEGLQAVEPGIALMVPILERAGAAGTAAGLRGFVRGAQRLGRVGTGLEAVRNLIAGGGTLATFFAPDSAQTDLAYYLERGESLPALLETTKGVAQVVAGSAGVGAAVLGPACVVATVPLGTVVSVGLVAVVTLDVLIYVSTAGGNPTLEFENKVRQASLAQFKLHGGRILLPDERLRASTTTPSRPQEPARCRLAKQLGTLHFVVRSRSSRVG